MKNVYTALLFFLFPWLVTGQELYNLSMPASTLPKGVLGLRIMNETYNESSIYRQMTAFRVMYGLGAKLTIICTPTASNYHSRNLPEDFIKHNHSGVGPAVFASVPAPEIYPYIFNSIDFYAQYRIFSTDGQNRHFRMAAYGEASHAYITSHLAEPDLMFHNTGIGGGIISTYLVHHFAATFTAGAIFPKTFDGNSYDNYGGVYPTRLEYGNAYIYTLALGYLLYPSHYQNYRQTNINLYLEFFGKSYGSANVVQQDGVDAIHLASNIPILKGNNYMDMDPGIQFIIHSNLRIDASVNLKFISESYIHTYPLYILAVQRYFYQRHKRIKKVNKIRIVYKYEGIISTFDKQLKT